MGVFYEQIPENIYEWILQQKMFWVATAPLSKNGHINVSPKGGEYFGLVDNKTFWYMDLSGSGVETISHLRENGRVTIMLQAFEGSPRIVRLWGCGRILERESPEFNDFIAQHSVKTIPATRSIIIVDTHQVGSSCGYSVPTYEFKGFRQTLNQVFEKRKEKFDKGKTDESMDHYWAYKSAWSIDGLPAMQRGLDAGIRESVEPLVKMIGPHAPPAPFGPKSSNISAQLRYRMARFSTTQINLQTVLLLLLLAFASGLVAATYGPVLNETYRNRVSNVLRL
ncbi:Putative pyridoxamine 5'-phosphate oxidase, FMN-binding split barrel [Septoria linicola]|uniref:Pyridoxamine 5'-phosphate oxidase, FMN-binding split barrel n=1 Tax=Septoria linicola TaxID=215465 RepID=A0A9Q9EJH8_9PEZI|nr:putative pyridoxamine 5'-phosphate oxidase, FMN-binding split barrel [Septoria linicola]USW53040.1 Putative pyridoxamine 5'-phosphate oxidase, FMN-binding split barrel [Septoria linicola]